MQLIKKNKTNRRIAFMINRLFNKPSDINIIYLRGDFLYSADKFLIGSRLRRLRERLSLTREKFSECIDISPQFLGDIENGNKGLSLKTMYKICDRFNISADYLLLGRENLNNGTIISDIISNLSPAYIPLAEDMLKTFLQTISISTAIAEAEKEKNVKNKNK